MNAMVKNPLASRIQPINQFCEKHHGEQMFEMMGRPFCKKCSLEALEQARSSVQTQSDFANMQAEKRMSNAMLPHRHKHCAFENYRTDHDGQANAKAESIRFYQGFLRKKMRNLVMVGRTGTGKTHLACALARNLLAKKQNIRYITSEDMVNKIAETWSKKQLGETEASMIARFVDCDLLILDEYGLHDQHETRLQLVHKVLYARYNARKPTMLISNFTKQQLQENLGDRLWSRFQEDHMTMVECDWEDTRSKQVAL
ncbi:ATP-binding protein [Acinetobacter pollinis]|uniref:ATP-binding protein n=1 Tax=Acinetobacter pollinis TaxID=2605270 RepID=A0ABU6DTV4_9GAMM|nr:ATP-binding protein [Acinetobacter pollinis]MEB5477284.1 ATP-binding protein [Acinetobacter pollinis]